MVYEDELLITYGLGHAFEKSKLLIVSEIEEKTILKRELDIVKEINTINRLKGKLDEKCDYKFPKSYIENVEEALEEKVFRTIPIITSIKTKNMMKQEYLMEEYIKKDISQMRLRKEGYIQKDSTIVKEYLDKCASNTQINIIGGKKYSSKYNRVILKIMLTTSFGYDFGKFLNKQGQADVILDRNKSLKEQLEDTLKNDYIIKKKYNELDFLNLLLFLEEWQQKYFKWDKKYTSLMFSINKNGEKHNLERAEIKDSVISFIKQKKYLYFPFGRYNENNMFITINDAKYYKKIENMNNNINFYDKQRYVVLEKKEGNLYEITSNDFPEVDLEYNCEIGYLLAYEEDNVYISLVKYNKHNEKIVKANKYNEFKYEMIKALYEHFII